MARSVGNDKTKIINMKTLLLTISIFAVISCTGQDVCTYSDRYVDSLNAIIETQDAQINQQSIFIGVQGLQISELTHERDSLLNLPPCFNYSDTLAIFADTAYFQIAGLTDNNVIKVNKQGNYSKITVSDGTNRIRQEKRNNDFDIWIMSDKVITPDSTTTFTRYSNHLDLR